MEMKNIAANLIFALCAIVFSTSCGTGKVPEVGSAEAAAQLQKDLKGTYEELFSENTSLNPKWDVAFGMRKGSGCRGRAIDSRSTEGLYVRHIDRRGRH